MGTHLSLPIALRVAAAAALFVLGGCGGLAPSGTPTINDRIAWSGYVFDEHDPAEVAVLLSQDAARELVAEYDPTLEIVALHAGELAPNVSGPSYLGYVVEVVRADGSESLPVLINAEEGALSGGPGLVTSEHDQDQ